MLDKIILEKTIGRELLNAERRIVDWINNWEPEIGLVILGLIVSAKEKGIAEGKTA